MLVPHTRARKSSSRLPADTHQIVNLTRTLDDSYPIVFGSGLFENIARDMREPTPNATKPLASQFAIITDTNVGPIYAPALQAKLSQAGLKSAVFYIPAGEENKTIEACVAVMREMAVDGFGRDSAILALGGGLVGDMAGFTAAVYSRGIPYVQIPTTLLAQSDSSVGGKTGVDLGDVKNLVGAFKQPTVVYIDIQTLSTLSAEDFRSGLAETIKHGIIRDAEFFAFIEGNIDGVIARDPNCLFEVVKGNCRIKGSVVEIDPEEQNLRKILNYGHTAGHAIEALSGFSMPHGYAVSIGMMVAGRISVALGYLPEGYLTRQKALLLRAGLPVQIPPSISNEDIVALTLKDKKAREGRAMYVLPKRIGEMVVFGESYATYVDKAVVLEALERTR
jgi:3-dehydroquinate synthase